MCLVKSAKIVVDIMIDVMLDAVTKQPLIQAEEDLAISTLLRLPMSVLHRKHRERIMASWQGANSYRHKTSVLALKIRVMRFPMFYEVIT